MNLLLDTHIFLWYITKDAHLSTQLNNAISDVSNQVYLSPVSIWEMIIKYQQGRLPLPEPPEIFLPAQRELHKIVSLPVTEEAVSRIAQLPELHKDPFDRLLIAQALTHELVLITVDRQIAAYPVPQL